jgi:hypothetical protein
MRDQQIAGALTLSVALAALGLIAAAPASALEDVELRVKVNGSTLALAEPGQRFPGGLLGTVKVKSRVKIKRVTDIPGSGRKKVIGVVRSRKRACEKDRVVYLKVGGVPLVTGVKGWATNRRGVWKIKIGGYGLDVKPEKVLENGFSAVVDREIKINEGRRGLHCGPDRSPRFTVPPPSEAGIAAAPASAAEEVREVKTRVTVLFVAGPGFYVKGSVRSSDEECERDRLVKLAGWQRMKPGRQAPITARTGAGDAPLAHRFTLYWDWGAHRNRNPPKRFRIKAPRTFREDGSLECEADVKRFAWRRY